MITIFFFAHASDRLFLTMRWYKFLLEYWVDILLWAFGFHCLLRGFFLQSRPEVKVKSVFKEFEAKNPLFDQRVKWKLYKTDFNARTEIGKNRDPVYALSIFKSDLQLLNSNLFKIWILCRRLYFSTIFEVKRQLHMWSRFLRQSYC